VRKENRLASEADFRRVRAEGRAWAHPLLVLHARSGGGPGFRLGVSTSKRIGKAVVRNRLRRRVRELFRARLKGLRQGWDVVIVVRPPAATAPFAELGEAVDQLLARARLRQLHIPSDAAPPTTSSGVGAAPQ
jgi:ribonuclease P protein component